MPKVNENDLQFEQKSDSRLKLTSAEIFTTSLKKDTCLYLEYQRKIMMLGKTRLMATCFVAWTAAHTMTCSLH